MLQTAEITDDYAARQIAKAQSSMNELSKVATARQKEGQSSVNGYFLYYMDYDPANKQMFTTENVPVGKSGPTNKGGKWFRKNAELIVTSIVPTGDITLNTDGTYTVKAKITVDAKTSASVLEYLRNSKNTYYYDPETDSIRDHVSVTVSPNMPYDLTLMVFAEAEFKNLYDVDPKTKKNKIRNGKPICLEGVTFGFYLKTYQKTGQDEGSSSTVFKDDFGITAAKMTLDDNASGEMELQGVSLCSVYDKLYPKDNLFLHDIKDVIMGEVRIPEKVHIYTSTTKMVKPESGNLIRITDFIANRGDVLPGYDSDKYETKIRAKFFCRDIYPKERKTYNIQFTAYEDTCNSTGLDTGDFDLWGDLLTAHTLTAHFLCKYSEKGTMSLTVNQPSIVATRPDTDDVTNGTYVFSVNQWIMDWEDTLVNRGIQITKEVFIDVFRNANKGLPSAEKKFKVATVDGNDELVFESVLPYPNPILNDGAYSKVINFGSGSRPTFSCSDASLILNHEGAVFYALTGIKTEDTEEWKTPEEGSEVFLKQLNEKQVKYQLFVVQNLNKINKK